MTAKPLPKIPDYGKNAIEVDSLSFAYRTDPSGSSLHNLDENSLVFQDLNLTLEKGSRCLLLGFDSCFLVGKLLACSFDGFFLLLLLHSNGLKP